MNVTLFKSPWALVGLLVCGGFLGWMCLAGAAPGARSEDTDVDLLLATGWTTLAIMLGVCLYSLRKFVHKLGISPEFKMKVPIEDLEEAEQQMNEVRRQVVLGILKDRAEVEAQAQGVLKRLGVHKVCRAVVTPAVVGPPFDVRVAPTEPLGRMAHWLHFHVYLGLASGVLLWIHGGLSMASVMGVVLNGLAALVIVTGVVGTFLFALGPRWMTRAEKDMNYEEAFVLDRSLKDKIKQAYEALKPEQVKRFRKAEKTASTAMVERTALLQVVETEPESKKELEDIMVLVAQRKRIRQDLRGAARIKFLINVWRAVHVPGSIVLLGFSIVHTFSVIWY